MATIKSLLSTALESFLTSKKEWVVEQSFPTVTTVDFVRKGETEYLYLIAPADGWVATDCLLSDANGSTYILDHGTGLNAFSTIVNLGNKRSAIFLPVRKGSSIEVRNSTAGAVFHYTTSSV